MFLVFIMLKLVLVMLDWLKVGISKCNVVGVSVVLIMVRVFLWDLMNLVWEMLKSRVLEKVLFWEGS